MTRARDRRARERLETLVAGILWRTACESLVESPGSATLDAYPRQSPWLGKFLASPSSYIECVSMSRMAHDVRPARDLRSFDATPSLLRHVIGYRARQTTVSRVQGEGFERAKSRKVAEGAISVCFSFSYGYGRRYRRVIDTCKSHMKRDLQFIRKMYHKIWTISDSWIIYMARSTVYQPQKVFFCILPFTSFPSVCSRLWTQAPVSPKNAYWSAGSKCGNYIHAADPVGHVTMAKCR
jgi:hypothetical protein